MTGHPQGYRELTASELDAVNVNKVRENQLGDWIEELRQDPMVELDPRFAAIAVTHFQQGFMALTRAITRPESRLK